MSPGNVRIQAKDGRDYDWLIISDFTAGIVQRPYGAQVANNGLGNNLPYTITSPDKPSAQFSPGNAGTFGCIANPLGGLQPLPLLLYGDTITPSITDTVNTVNTGGSIDYFGTLSQMVSPASLGGDYGDAIYFVIQYVNSGGADATTELREIFLFNGTNNPFANFTATSTGSSAIFWYNGPMVYYYDDSGTVIATLCFGSQNPSTDYSPGLAIVPATGGVLSQIGTAVQGWFFSHQGRLLFVNQANDPYNNANINTISFTDPPESLTLGTQQSIVVPVNFDDITSFGSLSSGELLLLCRQFGGVIVSGDIFNPIITTVPGVQGTQNLAGAGLITPLGMVYLSGGSGAWAWAGGSQANKLSPQLVNNFYDVDPLATDVTLFQITQMDNWLLFSNNWLYDMITSSWWQLPPNPNYQYSLYSIVNINGQAGNISGPAICAFPAATTNIPEYLSVMSYAAGYSDYQWTSNPMVISAGEIVELREGNITYSAANSGILISVNVFPLTPDSEPIFYEFTTVGTSPSTTYEPNKPVQQRFNINTQTDVVVIQITVTGADGSAVNIDSLELAYRTRWHLPTL